MTCAYRSALRVLIVLALACGSAGAPPTDQPVAPVVAQMGIEEARHLLSRATFGGSIAEIQRFAALPYEEGVQLLLDGVRTEPSIPPPEWADDPPREGKPPRDLSEEERRALRQEMREEGAELAQWWFREMLATPSPFTERLVLFWHNHFTSSLRKVKSARLMYEQHLLIRRQAAGNFAELLRSIPKDGAMAIYLDINNSRRDKPNENFARELLELFTLGEGHYSEKDIKECARAFTGWRIRPGERELHFFPRAHDAGEKTFLGRTGAFGGAEIIDTLLADERVAQFLVEKLWREFVSPAPDPAEVNRLAALFRAEKYALKPLLKALLLSTHFRDPRNRGQMIKSPVDLLVGTCRMFEESEVIAERLPQVSRSLGQALFDPPNVKGWPGGTSWIQSNTLLLREQFLTRFFQGAGDPAMDGERRRARRAAVANSKLEAWAEQLPGSGEERARAAERVLLAYPPVDPPAAETELAERIRDLIFDPAFQLK